MGRWVARGQAWLSLRHSVAGCGRVSRRYLRRALPPYVRPYSAPVRLSTPGTFFAKGYPLAALPPGRSQGGHGYAVVVRV